ncbi:unnamed protein product [Ostreobium quekettii]|uniref:Uncharacterized protein n=1 Tax=Ostreobium quekettii TaxID=121088 RepID=A0A8S1J3W9_9CHLO|nr:unnamed protein product [Ostreobium quekettii]|eukprot:evm.model.scf_3272.2 EVM.evm.TU.scf_3272.2   scf_3272:5141-12189(-)
MSSVNWNVDYLVIRLVVWTGLWLGVWIDGIAHRKSRGRGWKLHWGFRGVVTAYLVAGALGLDIGLRMDKGSLQIKGLGSDGPFMAYIFFRDVADAVFMLLISLVASGSCITRNTMGPNRKGQLRIVVLPIVYGITSLMMDYVRVTDCPEIVARTAVSALQPGTECNQALAKTVIASVVWNMVFVFSWVYVVESLALEIKIMKDDLEGARPTTNPPEVSDGAYPPSQQAGERAADGSDPKPQVILGDDEQGTAPKTVENAFTMEGKLRLLSRFYRFLMIYIFAALFVHLLPLGGYKEPIKSWTETLDVLHNLVLFICVTFLRPLDDNPYLRLEEDGVLDTDTIVTTELGVIAMEENLPLLTTASSRPA